MASPVSRHQVNMAVRDLNSKLASLGWHRRYRFEPGSHANGVNHKLLTVVPHLVHPVASRPIGNTYSKAHKYVEAMGIVLADALAERDRQRAIALGINLSERPQVSRTDERDGVDWEKYPAG